MVVSLTYIGQQLTIYGGFFFLVGGVIGNGMNIYIFSTVRNYRRTPCSFYFLIASIANTIYILIVLIARIFGTIYGIDFGTISVSWCKIRQFFIISLSLITLTCSCLATIDQFFVTSRYASLRQCSNIKWTHRIVFIMIIVCCLHAVPCPLFYDILPITNRCDSTNIVYAIYIRVYVIGLFCIIPVTVTVVFGCLTYRNIRQTRVLVEQNVDRQMARLTSFQVVLVVISFVPFGINSAYSLITEGAAKDANQRLVESLVTTIVTLITYLYYSGSCYMFLLSSSRFRQTMRDRILFWRRQNQIIPLHPTMIGRTM